jgi:uncharacterized membrane protein affecting hemolysin expression
MENILNYLLVISLIAIVISFIRLLFNKWKTSQSQKELEMLRKRKEREKLERKKDE